MLYLRRHRRSVEHSYSNTTRVNLRWLMWLAGAAGVVWTLAVVLKVTHAAQGVRDEHVALGVAIIIYSVGYRGLRQPEVFHHDTREHPVAAARVLEVPQEMHATAESLPRYERSGLGEDESLALENALRHLMDARHPWRDSELTLLDLASALNTTPHKLSEVLNAQIGQTFYDFVNGYRVQEVQRRIREGDARSLQMLALAMDAGFASKSTFNHAFKKHTQQTPSEFRQAVGA